MLFRSNDGSKTSSKSIASVDEGSSEDGTAEGGAESSGGGAWLDAASSCCDDGGFAWDSASYIGHEQMESSIFSEARRTVLKSWLSELA